MIVPSVMSEPDFWAIVRNGTVPDTEFVITFVGCQPSFVAITYDWIVAGRGDEDDQRVRAGRLAASRSAPPAFGAVTSNGSASTICERCADPRPAFSPLR